MVHMAGFSEQTKAGLAAIFGGMTPNQIKKPSHAPLLEPAMAAPPSPARGNVTLQATTNKPQHNRPRRLARRAPTAPHMPARAPQAAPKAGRKPCADWPHHPRRPPESA